MKNVFTKLTSKPGNIFYLILVFASVYYLLKIGLSDLWSDEVYTKSIIAGSFSEMSEKLRNDLHPPLYYLLLKLFTSVFGVSAIAMRIFSVIAILLIFVVGYFTGRRIFGEKGALYFSLMLFAVPMLSCYSHQARMYSWAAFTVTGVYLYSVLYLQQGKTRDLVFLFVFTLAAMYTHYYSLAAAFVANFFVFVYLLASKNKNWIRHTAASAIALLLYLPWLSMFIIQIRKVQHAFWAPPVSFDTLLACFTVPFSEQFWSTQYAVALSVIVYILLIFATFRSFTKSFAVYRLAFWLALSVFAGTLLVVTVISLFSQPILYSRYVMAIIPLIVVPHAILFATIKNKWVKLILMGTMILLGIKISWSVFTFSYGPYQQTNEYISTTYPEIKKVLHLTEVTAGPLTEYNKNYGLSHYFLKAKMSNVDAFTKVKQHEKPAEFLEKGEKFCVVQFNSLNLNLENLELVLKESTLIKTDTVTDNKMKIPNQIMVYILRYNGK